MFDLQPPRHISTLHEAAEGLSGRECPLCPCISDVDLFRYRDGIIHLDAKISHRAFDLRVAESWTARRLPVRR